MQIRAHAFLYTFFDYNPLSCNCSYEGEGQNDVISINISIRLWLFTQPIILGEMEQKEPEMNSIIQCIQFDVKRRKKLYIKSNYGKHSIL